MLPNIQSSAKIVCALTLAAAVSAMARENPKAGPADLSSEPVSYGARLEPPAGRVLHGWGQFSSAWAKGEPEGSGDGGDLVAYERATAPYRPAMLSFYTAPDGQITPAFIERYKRTVGSRGRFVAQIGLYFQSFQGEVANGDRDPELVLLADGLREARNPVLLRIGYEFNNPWVPYDPSRYIQAFRKIVGRLREVKASNVATVWNATAVGFDGANCMRWYPGDDVVDWWSVDLFRMEDFERPGLASFLDAARAHRKPVLIGEASPVFAASNRSRVRGPASQDEALAWYRKLIDLIRRRPEIKAVSLIAVDWRRLKSTAPGPGWPDTRLARWPKAAALWRQAVADRRFIQAEECASIYAR